MPDSEGPVCAGPKQMEIDSPQPEKTKDLRKKTVKNERNGDISREGKKEDPAKVKDENGHKKSKDEKGTTSMDVVKDEKIENMEVDTAKDETEGRETGELSTSPSPSDAGSKSRSTYKGQPYDSDMLGGKYDPMRKKKRDSQSPPTPELGALSPVLPPDYVSPTAGYVGSCSIDEYENSSKIGQGTFGYVYKRLRNGFCKLVWCLWLLGNREVTIAKHKETGKKVALKRIIFHKEKEGVGAMR